MSHNITVNRFDGHVQTIVRRGAVDFIFGDSRGLLTVSCDKFPFGIKADGELELPGGYPLPETPEFLKHVPEAKDNNELMRMALEICQGALAEYKDSPDFAADLQRHNSEWAGRPYGLHELGVDLVKAMSK